MLDQDYIQKMLDLESVISTVTKKHVTILIHNNPDGDAIASSLALSLWLEKKGFNVKIISPNNFSEIYMWLPNAINILVFDIPFLRQTIIEHINMSELVFYLDFNYKDRLSKEIYSIIKQKSQKLCIIDHHPTTPEKNTFECIDTSSTATCEILYSLFQNSKEKIITAEIAMCLYIGILTDTGKFMTPNVTAKTHFIVADMLQRYNIDISLVNKNIYGSNNLSRMRFLGYILESKLHIIAGYKVAYINISFTEASKFHLKPGDTDGIVNYALSLKDIVFAAMFNEKKDGIYISLRSIGDIAVNDFAAKYFSGGGHKNAAGGISREPLDVTINKFVSLIKKNDIYKT